MFVWNHNTLYHKLILNKLPDNCKTALDIGSGLGLFSSKLSLVFNVVLSMEPDKESIIYSKKKYKNLTNIKYINNLFEEHNFKDQKYDFISSIASIHHMDFSRSLNKMVRLLKPSGRLVILGLYKESTLIDLFISIIAFVPNLIMRLLSNNDQVNNNKMVTIQSEMSIKDIKNNAQKLLKNYKFRRHLFWRYTLIYDKGK